MASDGCAPRSLEPAMGDVVAHNPPLVPWQFTGYVYRVQQGFTPPCGCVDLLPDEAWDRRPSSSVERQTPVCFSLG